MKELRLALPESKPYQSSANYNGAVTDKEIKEQNGTQRGPSKANGEKGRVHEAGW